MPTPGPLPRPPAGLHRAPLKVVEVNKQWFRSFSTKFGPIHYGRQARYRFDHPAAGYGVFYVAEDHFGAFAETFGQLMSAQSKLSRMISTANKQGLTKMF